jgi:low affinity Fe/Cu permease
MNDHRGVPGANAVRARHDVFGRLSSGIARISGKPSSFFVVLGFMLVWALTGPFFGFTDTWLLAINTAGTIVTVLMVFLIQNTQNRATLALQLKLAELILVMEGTENKMALAEDLSHDDLQELKHKLRTRTDRASNS